MLSPLSACHATSAASFWSGDQVTSLRPVCVVMPPIASARAGLAISPVRSTAFAPAAFSLATTSGEIAAQLDATGAPLPRRTDRGPRARSGS